MDTPHHFCRLEQREGQATLFLAGDWRLPRLAEIDAALAATEMTALPLTLDGAELAALDTAAALALLQRVAGAGASVEGLAGFNASHKRVIEAVRARLLDTATEGPRARRVPPLALIGMHVIDFRGLMEGHLGFFGRSASALGDLARRPRALRLKELTAQFEQTCIKAIPVVVLVTFLIGVVLAYLFGMQAEKYGANILVVDAVAIGTCRELSPIIVAVIVAGRSGAAFTAQLGTMLLTEEIDAIRTLGLSPMQVLVIPRFVALIVALPLLVFVGDISGMAGAMTVANPLLDITPTTFIERVHAELNLDHVTVGLVKASVFAAFIAIIGCRMGMTVSRDSRSIGINTTSTVVQCIVAVILLDAFFAVLFQEIGI
ncbi:MAG TPA: ABC transporter permease [Burkholderiales bacterium]|nr:ABC transporter permease [Burkholderiales bacterium]